MLVRRGCITALAFWLLAGCGPQGLDSAINSPYPAGAERDNTLYTAFTQRSPKYLDPARSYSTDETPYTYNIYEPLYGYHYLKRPYELVPRAALQVAPPQFVDARGDPLPADAPATAIAESVYDIQIRPDILFAPHPAFARDAEGRHVYFPISGQALADKFTIPDFQHTGTRALAAQAVHAGQVRRSSHDVEGHHGGAALAGVF